MGTVNELVNEWLLTTTANILQVMKLYIEGSTTNILLDGGWVEYTDSVRELEDEFRVNAIGQKVYFVGWVQQTDKSDNSICVLPVKHRPKTTKEVMCMTDKGVDTITIRKNGEVIYNNASGGTLLNLSSTFYDKR